MVMVDLRERFASNFQRIRLAILSLNYRIPPGYTSWEDTSSSMSQALATIGEFSTDKINEHVRNCFALWLVKDAPIYCIDRNLLESLLDENLDNLQQKLIGLPIAIPTFLVLFPQGSLPTPDGKFIEYMVVHTSKKNDPKHSQGYSKKYDMEATYVTHESSILMDCCSVSSGSIDSKASWFAGVDLEPDGTISFEGEEEEDLESISLDDLGFIKSLRILILQFSLLLAYKPELLEGCNQNDFATKGRGFAKPNDKQGIHYRYPRWIGKNYESSSNSATNATHKSPIAHWRRGHWHKYYYGEGRKQVKNIWVSSTRVNEENIQ